MGKPAVSHNIGTHRGEIRCPDPVDLYGYGNIVTLTVKDICLFSGADGSAKNGKPFLMHEFVKREKGDVIKNILPYLELVGIPDADAHLFETLIEPVQLFVNVGLFLQGRSPADTGYADY